MESNSEESETDTPKTLIRKTLPHLPESSYRQPASPTGKQATVSRKRPRFSTADTSPKTLIQQVLSEKTRRKSSLYPLRKTIDEPNLDDGSLVHPLPDEKVADKRSLPKIAQIKKPTARKSPISRKSLALSQPGPSMASTPYSHVTRQRKALKRTPTLRKFSFSSESPWTQTMLPEAFRKQSVIMAQVDELSLPGPSAASTPHSTAITQSHMKKTRTLLEASSSRKMDSKTRSVESPEFISPKPQSSRHQATSDSEPSTVEYVPHPEELHTEMSESDTAMEQQRSVAKKGRSKVTQKKFTTKQKGKHESLIPRMPSGVTWSHFRHFAGIPVLKEVLPLVEAASDEFFQQLFQTLEVFAHHAGRNRIQFEDVILALRRQHCITDKQSIESLAERYLPREYREELIPTAKAGGNVIPSKRLSP